MSIVFVFLLYVEYHEIINIGPVVIGFIIIISIADPAQYLCFDFIDYCI